MSEVIPVPQPTPSERAFASLTEAEREYMSMRWLLKATDDDEVVADYVLSRDTIHFEKP